MIYTPDESVPGPIDSHEFYKLELQNPRAVCSLKKLVMINKSYVIFLCETLLNSTKINEIKISIIVIVVLLLIVLGTVGYCYAVDLLKVLVGSSTNKKGGTLGS